jgi:hypothetical protein
VTRLVWPADMEDPDMKISILRHALNNLVIHRKSAKADYGLYEKYPHDTVFIETGDGVYILVQEPSSMEALNLLNSIVKQFIFSNFTDVFPHLTDIEVRVLADIEICREDGLPWNIQAMKRHCKMSKGFNLYEKIWRLKSKGRLKFLDPECSTYPRIVKQK